MVSKNLIKIFPGIAGMRVVVNYIDINPLKISEIKKYLPFKKLRARRRLDVSKDLNIKQKYKYASK